MPPHMNPKTPPGVSKMKKSAGWCLKRKQTVDQRQRDTGKDEASGENIYLHKRMMNRPAVAYFLDCVSLLQKDITCVCRTSALGVNLENDNFEKCFFLLINAHARIEENY